MNENENDSIQDSAVPTPEVAILLANFCLEREGWLRRVWHEGVEITFVDTAKAHAEAKAKWPHADLPSPRDYWRVTYRRIVPVPELELDTIDVLVHIDNGDAEMMESL
jgi:hypothetical protein